MPQRRIYSSAINSETGDLILPWASLVMASLLLRQKSMSISEICLDLAHGQPSLAKYLTSQTYNALVKLEGCKVVRRSSEKNFLPTVKGKKEYENVLNKAAEHDSWKHLSDSKYM